MNNKFFPGDKVRVKEDVCEGMGGSHFRLISSMERKAGQVVTIKSIVQRSIAVGGPYSYRIEEDDYGWEEDWLEPAESLLAEELFEI